MNAIAKQDFRALTIAPSPELSALLTPAVYASTDPNDAPLRIARSVRPEHIAEAQAILARLEPALLPADIRAVKQWLGPVAANVRNPPNGQDFEARCRAVLLSCDDLPAAVWSQAAQREAMRRWEWWPASRTTCRAP